MRFRLSGSMMMRFRWSSVSVAETFSPGSISSASFSPASMSPDGFSCGIWKFQVLESCANVAAKITRWISLAWREKEQQHSKLDEYKCNEGVFGVSIDRHLRVETVRHVR